jgi:uncharacterized iron-regulated protein
MLPIRRRLLCTLAAVPLAGCAGLRASAADRHRFDAANLATALGRRPVVLLGEVHDNPVQHAVRAQALRLHLESGARPAIAFEQFDREQQTAIDQTRTQLSGTPAERAAQLVERVEQDRKSGWAWALYRPFIALALEFDVPIVAANLSRGQAMKVGRASDFDALFDRATQQGFGLDRLPSGFLREHEAAVDDGHCGLLPERLRAPLARAQIARDITLLQAIRPHQGRGVVLLTGNGHVRNDIGVPFLMTADERARTVTIGLLEAPPPDAPADASASPWAARFDVAFETPRHPRPDPCEPLRQRPIK